MEQRPNTVGDPSKNAQIKCLTKPKETVPLAVFRFSINVSVETSFTEGCTAVLTQRSALLTARALKGGY